MRICILVETFNNRHNQESEANIVAVNTNIDDLLSSYETYAMASYTIEVWYSTGEYYDTLTIDEALNFESK